MIAFVCLFISALGFSALLRRIDKQFDVVLSLLVGFCLVPVAVFFSYFAVNHNLRQAFQLTMALSLLGLLIFIYEILKKKIVLQETDKFIFGMMALTVLSFVVFGQKQFVGISWDEMTHWVLYPKQIMLNNTLISTNFLPGSVTWYLPGLAFLNLYGEGVTGIAANNADYLYSQVISTMLLVGVLSALVIQIFKNEFVFSALCLSLFFIFFRAEVYPVNNLIEVSQGHAILMLFVLMYLFEVKKVSVPVQVCSLSIVLAYAYLLKASNINLLPVVVYYCYLLSDTWKKFFRNVLLALGLTLAAYFIWKFYLQSSGISNLKTNMTVPFWENLKRRSAIPWDFIKNLFTQKHLIIALIISLPFIKYVNKKFTFVVYFYFITYVIGLFILYLFVFGEYEGLKLAAFDRYIKLALVSIKIHALFGLVFFLREKYGNFILREKLKPAFLALVIFSVGFNCYARFNIRVSTLHESVDAIVKYEKILNGVHQAVIQENLIKPKLLFIEQGGDGLGVYFTNYRSLENNQYRYLTSTSWSFNAEKKDVWTRVMTEEEFLKYTFEHQLVAFYKTDKWIDDFLEDNKSSFQCNKVVSQTVFVKASDKFTCL